MSSAGYKSSETHMIPKKVEDVGKQDPQSLGFLRKDQGVENDAEVKNGGIM